jgi:hypothetical protein
VVASPLLAQEAIDDGLNIGQNVSLSVDIPCMPPLEFSGTSEKVIFDLK